jgi:hypothetical protein
MQMLKEKKMKKIVLLLTVLAFAFTSFGPVWAADKGNKRKGKYTYRKVYKACMARGEVDAPKPVVNPDAQTQARWTEIFEEKDFTQFKCKPEWDALSEKALLDIYTYLYSYAADSPTPAI